MPPTAADVRHQLDRLLASAGFANAGRMSRFLKFVVEKTLAGEGERLKEYVVGIEVFDRDESYDPRLDSIVRVEAARLRAKLAEYYAGEGRDDRIVLTLPKGGYSPVVSVTSGAPANGTQQANGSATLAATQLEPPPRAAHTPRWAWPLGALLAGGAVAAAVIGWAPGSAPVPLLRIAVLPFSVGEDADGGAEALARQLTEGVTAELVRAGRFRVVASSAARAENAQTRRPREIAAALDADVLIQARVKAAGEALRVETYAVGGELEEKLWVHGFAGTAGEAETLERNIATAIADAVVARKIAIDR